MPEPPAHDDSPEARVTRLSPGERRRHAFGPPWVAGVVSGLILLAAGALVPLVISDSEKGPDSTGEIVTTATDIPTATTKAIPTATTKATAQPDDSAQRPNRRQRPASFGSLRRTAEKRLQQFATNRIGRRGACHANKSSKLPPHATAQQVCRANGYTLVYTRLRTVAATESFMTNRSLRTDPGPSGNCGATTLVSWGQGLYASRRSGSDAVLMWSYAARKIAVRATGSLTRASDLCTYWGRLNLQR